MNKPNITPAAVKAAVEGDMENFLAASTPGGIERQEAAGQAAMVRNFTTLPKEMRGRQYNDLTEGRVVAEQFGFRYGPDADELFVTVTPPPGWTLKATGHSMHSDILDDTGAVRGSIFYKAAFYDRRAHGSWSTRYFCDRQYDSNPSYSYTLHVRDRRNPEASLWSERFEDNKDAGYDANAKRQAEVDGGARAYLDANYPDWQEPTAYWS